MSERLHKSDVLSGQILRKAAVVATLAVASLATTSCEALVETDTGTFTCYTVGAEGGGINGPGKITASGTKPIPGEVAAADLNAYYGNRATDYDGNGRVSVAERNRYIREHPLRLVVPGAGVFRIEDTGGNFKKTKRFDLAMWRKDCKQFGRKVLDYTIVAS